MFLLLAILLIGGFLRAYRINEIPLGLYTDEAMNANNATEAVETGRFRAFYSENNGREGLFIALAALPLGVFGNEPWALRLVSVLFGTLTILGIYLAAKELLKKNPHHEAIALLASFFLASSYWHLNFSRIGFRAILVPFAATFAMYFLLRALRKSTIPDALLAGAFIGLGLYTYSAFLFFLPVVALPIGLAIWKWRTHGKKEKHISHRLRRALTTHTACTPCIAVLIFFIVFIFALPLALHFIQHPQDILARPTQISVFSAVEPVRALTQSTLSTARMLFVAGDCNWRHNFACTPQLNLFVSFFFIAGLMLLISRLVRAVRNKTSAPGVRTALILLAWLCASALPAALTIEGIPHALRAIGMLPAIMIIAAIGTHAVYRLLVDVIPQHHINPRTHTQVKRIRTEIAFFCILALLFIPLTTYRQYFIKWSEHPETYFAFAADILHLGEYLRALPQETHKYVIANISGVSVRGVSAPAQIVMFATDTFTEQKKKSRHITYLSPEHIERIALDEHQKTVIGFLDGTDIALINAIQKKYPILQKRVPGDFVILEN